MTENERRKVAVFLKRVECGLRGLPADDVEDTIAEMRTHLLEEIGERGDAETVLADFGDPEGLATQIVARRLRPEDGPAVPDASLGRRYSAWATDVVIGLGPLVLVPTLIAFPPVAFGIFGGADIAPIWILLVGLVVQKWFLPPEGSDAAIVVTRVTVPLWQWVLLLALVIWAVYYWVVLRRRNSCSAGLWMAGLRAVRVNGDLHVVRERDISQTPRIPSHGRNRWWILLAAIPTGCLCLLLAVYYVSFAVGSFLQPWEFVPAAAVEVNMADELEGEALDGFISALMEGDEAAAGRVAEGIATTEVRALADSLQAVPEADREWYIEGTAGRYDGNVTIDRPGNGRQTIAFSATVDRFQRKTEPGAAEVYYRVTAFTLTGTTSAGDAE